MRAVMRIRFCVAAVLALWMSCAASAADRNEYAAIHSVAVISAIGDLFFFDNDGPSILPRSGIEPLDISSWGIDPWVRQSATTALSTRFTVRQIETEMSAVRRCTAPEQCASTLPHTDSVDAYVLVYKAWIPDPITGMGNVAGLGILYHPGLFGLGAAYAIHATYGVAVIDARTGDVIDHGTARTDEHDFVGEHYSPVVIAPADLWPAHPPEMTAEQQNKAKQIITQQIDKTLMHALKNANLIPGGG